MRFGLRFRISDLLDFTLSIALGCAAARASELSWLDGTMVTLCALVAVTAGRECIALERARSSTDSLTQDHRFELTFLAWGRFLTVLLLVAVQSLDLLHKQQVIGLPEGEDFFGEVGKTARSGLIELALIICLCSPTFPRQKRLSWHWRTGVTLLAWIGAVVWGVIVLTDATLVHFLVYSAIQGIESAQPARFARSASQQAEWVFAQG